MDSLATSLVNMALTLLVQSQLGVTAMRKLQQLVSGMRILHIVIVSRTFIFGTDISP